jgi:hypothetical protein
MDRQGLFTRLENSWIALQKSMSDIQETDLVKAGAVGEWSLKDVLAHVSTWEEETLKALPLLIEGKRAAAYHGIDRFNAEQHRLWRDSSLADIRKRSVETHRRLLEFLAIVHEEHFSTETRIRRRLRMDTYRHYREHAASILEWRKRMGLQEPVIVSPPNRRGCAAPRSISDPQYVSFNGKRS